MKKFSNALLWLTASEIIFNIAAYIVHSVVGRILGPADYGRYGLVITLTTMVIVLIGNGIPTAMSKYLSELWENNPENILAIKKKAAFLQTFLIGTVTVIFFLSAPFIAWLLKDPTLLPLFQLSAVVIPAFAAASFYHHYLTGLHLFKLQAIVKIVRSFARVGFIALAAVFFGLEGAVGGYILAPLFTFGIALLIDEFYIKRKLGFGVKKNGHDFDFPTKTILAYAGPLTLFLVFYELLLTIDLYFVKALLKDDHLTGLYNAAITVGRIPYYLFAALAMIILPAISKTTAERSQEETTALVSKSLRLMTLLLFPMITLLITYALPLLHFFYGTRYDQAANAMGVFSLGVGGLTVFYVLSFALNGAGLVKIPMRLSFFGFLLMVIFNFILIPRFGIVGAALSATLTAFVLMSTILFFTKKYFHVHLPSRTIISAFIVSLIIAFIARFLPGGTLSFLFSGAVLFIGYFGILRLIGELRDDDIFPFKKFLPLFSKKDQK
ncbi:MAG: flippase [Candidatus Moranbacteria bacterium]|nr:flippase [Candidatus Moranbacteria bacterium]